MTVSQVTIQLQLSSNAKVPLYATPGAAGADIFCSESWELNPQERRLIPTGLRMAIPEGYEVQIRPRSGTAIRSGLGMVNSPGTIDSDYRGEIGVILINFGSEPIRFEAGERVAQMVVCPVVRGIFEIVDSLPESERGDGGFGSTGTN
ncbi:MAG: dUTP diphosphatase [Armatimonadetes bacterium]|nr:dUTP diphosphatase [Armatimonadota bacterium]